MHQGGGVLLAEIDLSEFKMFEDAPYELPEPKALIGVILGGLKEEEKIYGPVFTSRFIKYAQEFIAQKTGETPPEGISSLEQLAEYLESTTDKYAYPWCALIYAHVLSEVEFHGHTGAATKLLEIGASKVVAKKSFEQRGVDVDEIMVKLRETTLAGKVSPKKLGYKKNQDDSFDILWPECYYLDACRILNERGVLKRPDGRPRCGITAFVCQFFKMVTGYEWDYDSLEAHKPHCVTRCYMI